jgi:uncharacterized protein YkwD
MGAHAARAEVLERSCAGLPSASDAVLQLNLLRARSTACAGQRVAAAPALRWDDHLAASAQAYAHELALRKQLSHDGVAAPRLRDRVRAAGYRMRLAGENLAMGPVRIDELMAMWMASPEHCANLMEPRFVDVGLACAPGQGDGMGEEAFWVLHLGRGQQDGP